MLMQLSASLSSHRKRPAIQKEFGRLDYGYIQKVFLKLGSHFPPIPEQQAIITYIKKETAKLDALNQAAERTIRLLKEHRTALIAAAVTGQIEVGGKA